MGIFSTNIWSPDIRLKRTALIACFVALCTASQAPAGNFRVTPIRLELDRGAKSGAITVINEGTETMNFQVSVSEWTQDDKGKDVYADTAVEVHVMRHEAFMRLADVHCNCALWFLGETDRFDYEMNWQSAAAESTS